MTSNDGSRYMISEDFIFMCKKYLGIRFPPHMVRATIELSPQCVVRISTVTLMVAANGQQEWSQHRYNLVPEGDDK